MYIYGDQFIKFAVRIFSSIYYEKYAENIGSGSGNGMLILLIFIFVVCYINESRRNVGCINQYAMEKIGYNDIWLHMLLLAILFNFVALRLEIAARIMWFFKPALIFLIPNTFRYYRLKSKSDYVLFIGILIVCIVLPFIYYSSSIKIDNFGIVPYEFFN